MSEWQPIETYVHDGIQRKVLTCWRGVDIKVNTFTDHTGTAPGYRLGKDQTWWNSEPDKQPTHWMPIPEPPK